VEDFMLVVRYALQARWIEPGNGGIRSLMFGRDGRHFDAQARAEPPTPRTGDGPLGSHINMLRIRSLKAQVEASRLYSASLASEFERATIGKAKTRIASRYDEALKQTHKLQLICELLERKEKEADHKKENS